MRIARNITELIGRTPLVQAQPYSSSRRLCSRDCREAGKYESSRISERPNWDQHD